MLSSVSAALAAVDLATTVDTMGSDPIFPEALVDSWPRGLNLQYMHCPMSFSDLSYLLRRPEYDASARGTAWRLRVAHCIVGRWFFLFLESGAKEQRLSEVLNVDDATSRYERSKPSADNGLDLSSITVDFSGGLQKLSFGPDGEPAVASFAMNSDDSGHHDAKFCALRDGKEIIVCVRMRYDGEPTEGELVPLCLTSRDEGALFVDALLFIGGGPSSSAAFGHPVLQKRAGYVDGSRFSRSSFFDLLDATPIKDETLIKLKTTTKQQ